MTDIAEAKPSSTVILARDDGPAPSFLLVERHADSSFGGACVFPGGVVESDDETAAEQSGDLEACEANAALQLESGALAYYSAALRELYEETGILLAESSTEPPNELRREMLAGRKVWADLLRKNAITLPLRQLHYVSFWITPTVLPKRYSTRFFVAQANADTDASPCGGEVLACRWMSARDALSAADRGEITLHFPTRITLEGLAAHANVAALIGWASRQATDGVACIFPTLPEKGAVLDAVRRGAR